MTNGNNRDKGRAWLNSAYNLREISNYWMFDEWEDHTDEFGRLDHDAYSNKLKIYETLDWVIIDSDKQICPDEYEFDIFHNELHTTSLLYKAMKSSLDQTTPVNGYKILIDRLDRILCKKLAELEKQRKGSFPEEIYDDHNSFLKEEANIEGMINPVLRRVHEELQIVEVAVRNANELIYTIKENRISGAQKKYSERFIIIILAKLFEDFDVLGSKVTVYAIRLSNKSGESDNYEYQSRFFEFVQEFFTSISSDGNCSFSNNGLGQIIKDAILLRKKHPCLLDLIRKGSIDDIMKARDIIDGKTPEKN